MKSIKKVSYLYQISSVIYEDVLFQVNRISPKLSHWLVVVVPYTHWYPKYYHTYYTLGRFTNYANFNDGLKLNHFQKKFVEKNKGFDLPLFRPACTLP